MDGRLDAAMSIAFLFYVVSISESRHFVCKCFVSRIVQMLQLKSKSIILFVCGDIIAVGSINYVLIQLLYWTSLRQRHFTVQ